MIRKLMFESYIDMSTVGEIEYEWDFEEDDYQDWLQENEENPQDTPNNRKEYINDNVQFEISYLDNETYHYMDSEYMYYSDLEDTFGEKAAQRILNDCMTDGKGKMETYELYEDEEYDINNPDELNQIAVKLLQHGNYYKNCRGFILTNGEVVYTPAEHNECTVIDGVKGTFHFIRLGNIRVLQNSIDLSKQPTSAQRDVLRKVVASYEGETLYVDIIGENGECSAQYYNPSYSQVIGEIDRFFREGIKLQGGNNFYESKNSKSKRLNEDVASEDYVICYWGCPDDVHYENSETYGVKDLYYDQCGYTFGIWDGQLVCGNDNDETSSLMHLDLIQYHIYYHGWGDILPVKDVNPDAWDWDELCNTQVDYDDDEEYPEYHDEETGELLPEYRQSYGDLIKSLGDPDARGRILYDWNHNVSFISFWSQPTPEEVQRVIRAYGSMAKQAYWVSFNNQEQAEEYFKDHKPFTCNDWLKGNTDIPKIETDEEQLANHLKPAKEKWEATQNFRDAKNQKLGNKLSMYDRNGKYKGEMPMAKYNSMIYQEGKNVGKILEVYHVSDDVNTETEKVFDYIFEPEMENLQLTPIKTEDGWSSDIEIGTSQTNLNLYGINFLVIFNVINYKTGNTKDIKNLGNFCNSNVDYQNKIIKISCAKYKGGFDYDSIKDSIGHEMMHLKKIVEKENKHYNIKPNTKQLARHTEAQILMNSDDETNESIGTILYYSGLDEKEAFRSGFYNQLTSLKKNHPDYNLNELVKYCTFILVLSKITFSKSYIESHKNEVSSSLKRNNILNNVTYEKLTKLAIQTENEYKKARMEIFYRVLKENDFISVNKTNVTESLKMYNSKPNTSHYIR